MKLYIATPINNRPEETMAEKLQAAARRVDAIRAVVQTDPAFAEYDEIVSTFDVNPIGQETDEETAMARCIELVKTCDAIILDRDLRNKWKSKGMQKELHTIFDMHKPHYYIRIY